MFITPALGLGESTTFVGIIMDLVAVWALQHRKRHAEQVRLIKPVCICPRLSGESVQYQGGSMTSLKE